MATGILGGEIGIITVNATELKLADGTGTGFWYCVRCKEVHKSFERHSADNREKAEECCTGRERWVKCCGCRKEINMGEACKCLRRDKNRCVSCNGKLMFREGTKVRWGIDIREVCYFCAKKVPTAMLMDAPKYSRPKAAKNKAALTAPDTSLSTLAPKTGAEKGPVVKPDAISLKDQKYSWMWKR